MKPKRIKVLYLITELNIGGAERVVEQLATQLSRGHYNVSVACLYDPGAIADEITASGVPVVNLGMQSKWDLAAAYRLFRLLRNKRIQILHSHLFHANLLAALVGRLANTPIIIATRHSIDIDGMGRERVNRWVRSLCDAVVAVSKEVREAELQRSRTGPSKVVMIPNGVQIETFTKISQADVEALRQKLRIHPNTAVIGTVASFNEYKGHTYLIDATVRILEQLPDTKVLLVGGGPLRSQMEDKAEALGLLDYIIFTGIRQDIPRILSTLDLFVLPSLWEGMPIVLLEAMAAGLPVVATRVGGIPEVVEHGVTGLLVPPRDPEALAQAIIALLQDRERAEAMGQAGRARVEKYFSVERMVQQTEALYEDLIGGWPAGCRY